MSTTLVGSDNPFALLHNGLWELVESNPDITTRIPEGNRVKYLEDMRPKDAIADADLPELALISQSTTSPLTVTSSELEVTRIYAWALTTGDFRINQVMDTIAWELVRSMLSWETKLCRLKWRDNPFVHDLQMGASQEGTKILSQNRNIQGWAFIWPFTIMMRFLTKDVKHTGET